MSDTQGPGGPDPDRTTEQLPIDRDPPTQEIPVQPVPAPAVAPPVAASGPIRAPRNRKKIVLVAAAVVAAVLVAGGIGAVVALSAADRGTHERARPGQEAGGRQGRLAMADERRQWAQEHGQDVSTAADRPDVGSATDAQRAAASTLLQQLRTATAGYTDTAKAKAAGFDVDAAVAAAKRQPAFARRLQAVDAKTQGATAPVLRVVARAHLTDGKVLDPAAPEALLYRYAGNGAWTLIGAAFAAGESYPDAPPTPGGPITRWNHRDDARAGGLAMPVYLNAGDDLSRAFALAPPA